MSKSPIKVGDLVTGCSGFGWITLYKPGFREELGIVPSTTLMVLVACQGLSIAKVFTSTGLVGYTELHWLRRVT